MARLKKAQNHVPHAVIVEAWFFIAAVAMAVYFFQSGTVDNIIAWALDSGSLFAGVIAGSLYSTFITTPFAVATLVGIGNALQVSFWQVAIVGALGATMSDLALARFLRSPLSLYVVERILGRRGISLELGMRRNLKIRFLAVVLGAILVAIPIPTDELAIALFDAAGLRFVHMLPIFLGANFIAIYAILTIVHAIA